MIRDYNEYMDRLGQLRDEMKILGIEAIDLDSLSRGITTITLNDAEPYCLLRRAYSPEDVEGIKHFKIGGWLDVRVLDYNGTLEAAYKESQKIDILPF